MNNKIIIYIVDDEEHVRDAISLLMASVGFKTKKFSSSLDLFEDLDTSTLGCIISDIRMPIMGGMELLEKINKDYPSSHIPIILITGHGDIRMAVRAIQNGASDFLEKPFDNQNLLDKVNKAIESSIEIRQLNKEVDVVRGSFNTLTEKETKVFELIAQGDTNKVISQKLCVTQSTIEARRAKIIKKMKADNVSELIAMAVTVGLI